MATGFDPRTDPQVLRPVGPEPDPWIGLGVALVVLAAAGWLAWRRSRADGEAPRRFVRIFMAAAVFGVGMALIMGVDELDRAGLSWLILPMVGVAAGVMTFISLILFGLADFWLGLVRPRRSRRWLVVAIFAFVLIVTACFALAAWIMGDLAGIMLHPGMLQMLALSAAAGLVWWAHLPAPRADLARRFE